ncbi:MAG: hypothetical protein V1835_05450 [Candidatus Micrarchaeota archaeon]
MKVYLDTSVYDAAWLNEARLGIDVSDEFGKFKASVLSCNHSIVVSRIIENEILRKYPELSESWQNFLMDCKNKLIFVKVMAEHKACSKALESKYSNLHFPDSLHLAVAMSFSDAIITYDFALEKVAGKEFAVKKLVDMF